MNQTRIPSLLAALLACPAIAQTPVPAGAAHTVESTHRLHPGQSLVPLHGLAIQVHRAHDVVLRLAPRIREIAALGANSMTLSLSGYQDHAGSWRIRNDPERTPRPEDVARLVAVAQANGLRVILMPKILLSDPRGSEWRGRIQPPSWDDWFGQYRRFIVEWARLAEQTGVEVFVVGSELVSTETRTNHWLRTIADVRQVYNGQLAYSANWDHYSKLKFWPKVDLVGITTYYKLSEDPLPRVADMTEAWHPIKQRILDWQKKVRKPLLFTEVGWASQPGCSIEPWNYYRHQSPSTEGLEEQRRCYAAFVRVWADVPQLAGTIWWEWTDSPGGPDDFGYTPKGKPAERVLRDWFASQARHPEPLHGLKSAQPAPSNPPSNPPSGQQPPPTKGVRPPVTSDRLDRSLF